MQSIKVTRPVVVKVRVTDRYKQIVVSELQKAVQKLELELQHLEFQYKRFQKENTQLIEKEISERLVKKQKLMDKIKEVAQLKEGTEVVHGRVESLVDLKVGDDWNKVMNVEVLVEDGTVLEIRNSLLETMDNGGE